MTFPQDAEGIGLWTVKAWSARGERLKWTSAKGVGWGVGEDSDVGEDADTEVVSPEDGEALSARALSSGKEKARTNARNDSDFIGVYRFKSVGDDSITLV